MKKVLILCFMLLLTAVTFASDAGPPMLDGQLIENVEFSSQDHMNTVTIFQEVLEYNVYTGEGIVLKYSLVIADDPDMLSEAFNDISNSVYANLLVNERTDFKLYNNDTDLYSNQWNQWNQTMNVHTGLLCYGPGDIFKWASL